MKILKFRYLALYIFTFSLCFEYYDPFGIRNYFSITKMAGVLYFILSLIDYKHQFASFNKSSIPQLLFLFILLIFSSLIYLPDDTSNIINFSFLQCIILYWILSNEFRHNPNVMQNSIISFIIGVTFLSFLSMNGIGTGISEGRLKIFGTNPNLLGNFGAMSFLLVIGFLFKANCNKKTLFILLSTIPFSLFLIAKSASRGALLCIIVGTSLYIILYRTRFFYKFLVLIAGSLIMYISLNYIMNNQIMQKRIANSMSEGDVGGRTEIWEDALNIFADNPILGVGEQGYIEEMQKRYSYTKDTHNVFIHILVSTGLAGFIIYLFFFYRIFNIALIKLRNKNDALPIVLFFSLILIMLKTGDMLTSKMAWLIISYILSKELINSNLNNNEKYELCTK